jgi:hypothetical protein
MKWRRGEICHLRGQLWGFQNKSRTLFESGLSVRSGCNVLSMLPFDYSEQILVLPLVLSLGKFF